MSPPTRPAVAVRVFLAFLVARAIFGLTYIASTIGRVRIFWYHPLDHTWEFAAQPSGPAMGWYGLTATALLVAGLGGALAYASTARGPLARALARASVVLAIAHAGGLVLFVDFAYFGWTLTHQKPVPWKAPECPAAAEAGPRR